jgi:ABC-type siderophore export system fused ATPase/permease subunit
MNKTILEREGYRFVQKGIIELNGKPDYRMQKQDYYTKRWNDIYLFDNSLQLTTAMEDQQYARWLDPDRVPCYVKDYDDEDMESL